jgi:hypothetical protein
MIQRDSGRLQKSQDKQPSPRHVSLWGARSGKAPQKDRRSGFSAMQRELDQQFGEKK